MLNTILPVLFIFGVGYVCQKIMNFNIHELSRMTIYAMLPFLSFHVAYTHHLSLSDGYVFIASIALFAILIVIVYLFSLFIRREQCETYPMLLVAVFMNSGNYGIPVVLFALGEQGRPLAVLLMVFHGFVINSLGIYYASKGGSDHAGIGQALGAVIRMPVLYAMLLGIAFQMFGIVLPANLMTSIKMVGDASIPAVMLVLGMQLALSSLKRVSVSKMAASIFIRLIVSPFLAWGLILWLPVDPLVRQIFVLMSGMPTAANTAMLAIRFDADPEFVSSATFLGTLLSVPTISVILYLIERGAI